MHLRNLMHWFPFFNSLILPVVLYNGFKLYAQEKSGSWSLTLENSRPCVSFLLTWSDVGAYPSQRCHSSCKGCLFPNPNGRWIERTRTSENAKREIETSMKEKTVKETCEFTSKTCISQARNSLMGREIDTALQKGKLTRLPLYTVSYSTKPVFLNQWVAERRKVGDRIRLDNIL